MSNENFDITLHYPNPPAAAAPSAITGDSASNASNLNVLLLAAAMVTSPNATVAGVTNAASKKHQNNNHHRDIISASAAVTTSKVKEASPTVTPPFTIELVDDIPLEILPSIRNSTPPKMKTPATTVTAAITTTVTSQNNISSKYTNRGKRGFALPLKKRWSDMHKNSLAASNMSINDATSNNDATIVTTAADNSSDNNSTNTTPATTNIGGDNLQLCIEVNNPPPPTTTTTQLPTTQPPPRKKYRKPQCSHPNCNNRVMNSGVCARHGARVRTCSMPGCTKYAQKGGVCIRHGAVKEYKRCLVEGCNSRPVGKEGVCNRHAGADLTSSGLATNATAANGKGKGLEQRQDLPTGLQAQPQARDAPPKAKTASKSRKKKCSVQTCTKQAKVGGLCMKHGGKVKYRFCNAPNCGNVTQKGGYCKRHFNDLVGNKKRKLSEVEDVCTIVGGSGGKV